MDGEVEEDRDGAERERRPQDLARHRRNANEVRHAATLARSAGSGALRLGPHADELGTGEPIEQFGVAERLDVAVFSSEVGRRKPDARIFEHALSRLDVPAQHALFVGDSLHHDVGGAARLGMTTMQALWFRADDRADGSEPDFRAFTPFDVLNVVRRLRRETG
jgi:phosphoglycolate phosphatase-like HAD superfamily hydrolase